MQRMGARQRFDMYAGLRVVVCVVLLLLSDVAMAVSVRVVGATGVAGELFVAALARELGKGYKVSVSEGAASPVIVALNEASLPEARRLAGPLLAVLPEADHDGLGANEGVLYWAPSWSDQLRLARRIFPSLRRVGILLDSGGQQTRVLALREQLLRYNLELVVKEVDPALLVRNVAELAGSTDVIIAPADSSLFTRDTIKPILMAAYRQQRVFIGPTPAVVRAGALASLHVSPEMLAIEVAERIRRHQKDGRWGAAARVTRFDVTTNPQVARSLGLRLPDPEELTRQWRMEESTPWP